MLIYLAGAIEYAPDKGKAWREAFTPFVEALGAQVYDPARDEQKNLTDDERLHFREWKSTDLPRFQRTIRKIINWDMEWITRRADAIVVYWDEYAGRGAGTSGELTAAYRYGKPVYLVAGMPVAQISGWILGCATEVFNSFDQLQAFLAQAAASRDLHETCVCCNAREDATRPKQASAAANSFV
jgi:nucleoside 2-deoxyribosyltransferase